MKPVILLIDLQNDFLNSPSLEPAAGQVIACAARLLEGARERGLPVIHIWTTVDRQRDQRMPHWKSADRWICVEGSPGHQPPSPLLSRESEHVVHKTFFSAFSTGELDRVLKSFAADTVVLAGVHLHGCVRSTALDAYQRGLKVLVAEDAVASDDPLHASISQRWLASRAARFLSVEACFAAIAPHASPEDKPHETTVPILPVAFINGATTASGGPAQLSHCSPIDGKELWRVGVTLSKQVSEAVRAAGEASIRWRAIPTEERSRILIRLTEVLTAESETLTRMMAVEIGKPITLARAELTRSVALLKAVAAHSKDLLETKCTENSVSRNCPLGVVAIITPWNNPVAIPLGKIAPALLYGNAVVWKPAPAGSSIAVKVIQMLQVAGCPPGLVNLVCGDHSTALALMAESAVDAVTITGSPAAGYSAQDICARRHVPLQAELGGNNAAIVWRDSNLDKAVQEIADAAFAFAGQRCTANRRVIVHEKIYDRFLEMLHKSTAALVCGNPLDSQTRVGPLVSLNKCREVTSLLERTKVLGASVFHPHKINPSGAFFPPTIVRCDDSAQEIVQEETFGPILVVQKAADWDHAMQLCNGVRQGLIASLFSSSSPLHEQFLNTARAGILKINMATADANVEAPFGGWKASGIGPPEHGLSNREFYTRTQAVYL